MPTPQFGNPSTRKMLRRSHRRASRVRALEYTNGQVEQNRLEGNFANWDSVQIALARTVLAEGYADDQEIRTLIGEDAIYDATQFYSPAEDSDPYEWEDGMGARSWEE